MMNFSISLPKKNLRNALLFWGIFCLFLAALLACDFGLWDHECLSANDCKKTTQVCTLGACINRAETGEKVPEGQDTNTDEKQACTKDECALVDVAEESSKEMTREPNTEELTDQGKEKPGTELSTPDGSGPEDNVLTEAHNDTMTHEEEGKEELSRDASAGSEVIREQNSDAGIHDVVQPEKIPEVCPPGVCPSYWFVEYGQPTTDETAKALLQDKQGNIYVTGGEEEHFFLAKFDSKGKNLWKYTSTTASGATGRSLGYAIALDSKGNIVVAGQHGNNHKFDNKVYPLVGPVNHINVAIMKFSPKGALLWFVSAGGGRVDRALDMVLDAKDQIYIAGDYSSPAKFGTFKVATGGGVYGGFIAKLDSQGKWLWAQGIQNGKSPYKSGKSICSKLALHTSGVFVTCAHSYQVRFGTLTITQQHGMDTFVAKLDTAGKVLWHLGIKGKGNDIISDLLVDKSGALILAFSFTTELSLGTKTYNVSSNPHIALAKYDPSTKKWLWSHHFKAQKAYIRKLSFDGNGQIMLSGIFMTTLSFGSLSLSGGLRKDFNPYIAKMDTGGKLIWATHAKSTSDKTTADALYVSSSGTSFVAGQYSNKLTIEKTDYTHTSSLDTGNLYIFKVDDKGKFQ